MTPDDKWQFWLGSGSTWQVLTGPAVTLNVWTYLAVTVAPAGGHEHPGHDVRQRRAGCAADVRVFGVNTTRPLRVAAGETESTAAQFLPGVVDNAAFYNTALSATRVNAHYTTGKNG